MVSPERPIDVEIAKATPEAVAVGVAISQLGLLNLAIQTGATLALRESLHLLPPQVLAPFALTVFLGTVVTSILYEAHVLEKIGFTHNPVTTLAHLKIENPILSAVIGNLYGQIAFLWNPINMGFSLSSLASGDGGLLLFSNLLARSLVGFTFYNTINFALYHGHAEKLVAKIHQLRINATKSVLNQLDRFQFSIESSLAIATAIAAYQEGSISHDQMLDTVTYFGFTPFSSQENTVALPSTGVSK